MSRVPTILHLLHDLEVGGAQRAVADLAVGLRESGRYRPVVCARRRDGPVRDRCAAAGVETAVLAFSRRPAWLVPMFLADLASGLRAIVGLAESQGVDLVHAHMSDSAFWGALAAWRLGCPLVVTVHSNTLIPYQLRRRVIYRRLWGAMFRRVLRRADRVIAVSPAVRGVVCLEGGVSPERVDAIANGISVPPAPRSTDRARLLRELGVSEGARVIISVGRLVANKRQIDLVEMMARLLPDIPDAVLLLIGDGPERDAVGARVRELGLERGVVLAGERADVADLLAASEVFAVSSLFEGVSLAMLEAMASGLPVVAYAAPGVSDVLAGGAGVVLEGRDPSAMAAGVARVLRDAGWARDLGARARCRVVEEYSIDRVVREVAAIYDSLLGNGARST